MAEFSAPAKPGPLIIVEGKKGLETFPLSKLLPRAFTSMKLKR
jgi:cytidine deaminase